MSRKNCIFCGREIGALESKVQCADGFICGDCYSASGFDILHMDRGFPVKSSTVAQMCRKRDSLRAYYDQIVHFQATYQMTEQAKFDDNRSIMILSPVPRKRYNPENYVLLRYDQVVDFELLEDGTSVASGGLGRAAVGGLLFGETGAIVGGVTGKHKKKELCNQMLIKITLRSYPEPAFYYHIITSETKKSSAAYKAAIDEAQKLLSKLQLIVDAQKNRAAQNPIPQQAPQTKPDPAEEIRKYKALLDDGIITEDEFEAKKKQLLNI